MSFRTVTRRDRLVRRAAMVLAAAGVTALGVVTVPLVASAQPGAPTAVESAAAQAPTPDETTPAENTAPSDDPKPEDDKPGDDKPGDDEPGDDKPKDEKPGEDDKPDDGGTPVPQGTAIAPGAQLITLIEGEPFSCTANFVHVVGDRVFIGSAAHCHTETSDSTDLDGCDLPENASQALGSEIIIEGFDGVEYVATLAYSSWLTMQENGEDDPATCNLNDFALLEIAPEDVDQVDPTVPVFGGPEGLDEDGVGVGEPVYSYQNPTDAPLPTMRAKQGLNLGNADRAGLGYVVETTTPGLPGDSGSGYLDSDGDAFGVLSSEITLTDGRIVNGVTDLAKALAYAVTNDADLDGVAVVQGNEPFSASGVLMDALPDGLASEDRLTAALSDLLSAAPLGG